MSLEACLEQLTAAVQDNNRLLEALLEHRTADARPEATDAPEITETPADDAPEITETPADDAPVTTGVDDAPEEVTWYHAPEEQRVWSETGPAKRRKGVYKVDEATAEKLQAKYAAEAEPEAEAAEDEPEDDAGPLDDLGFTGDPEPETYDESTPMDDDTWGENWKEWGKRARAHAVEKYGEDDAEKQMKAFLLPLVRSFMSPGAAPKIGDIPATHRARFLNKAEDFFNS